MGKERKSSKPDPWGQRVVFLNNGAPVRRVPVSLSRRFFQICMAVAAEVGAQEGLTATQFGALTYLYDEPELDQIALAARLGIDRTNTSALLDVLEKKGLVERNVSKTDRRAKLVHLTRKGERTRDRLRPKAGVAQAGILAPLSPRDRERFLDMLLDIIEANEAYARPGAGRRKPRRGESGKSKVEKTGKRTG